MPPRYRQHDQVAGPPSSPLQLQVAHEWVRLNHDASIAVLLRRWAVRHPALAGMERPADVVDAIDEAPPAGKDQLLLALVELFQSGEQLAGRIALQAMLPKLSHYALRTGVVARLESRPDDRFQVVLCEFWEILSCFPVARRTTRVAANLALETLHRLTRVPTAAELPVDPSAISGLAEPPGSAPARSAPATRERSAEPDPDGDLDALLGWAIARRAISLDDAQLLREVYVARESAGVSDVSRGYRERSASTGMSQAALRQRARRAKQRLATAVGAALCAESEVAEPSRSLAPPDTAGPTATA